nr:hypothetical protein Itr_chr13CG20970 [Ipomoea trifida]
MRSKNIGRGRTRKRWSRRMKSEDRWRQIMRSYEEEVEPEDEIGESGGRWSRKKKSHVVEAKRETERSVREIVDGM